MIAEARARGDLERVRRVARTATTLAWRVGLRARAGRDPPRPLARRGNLRDRAFALGDPPRRGHGPALGRGVAPDLDAPGARSRPKSMANLNALIAAIGIATIIPMAWFFGVRGAVAQLVVVAAAYAWLSGRLLHPCSHHSCRRSPARPRGPAIDRSLLGRSSALRRERAPRRALLDANAARPSKHPGREARVVAERDLSGLRRRLGDGDAADPELDHRDDLAGDRRQAPRRGRGRPDDRRDPARVSSSRPEPRPRS